MTEEKELQILCHSFENNGIIPKKHTGFGQDISPAFEISNLCEDTVSIAIIMDDLDIPFIGEFTHWVIWNIPRTDKIPESIPQGSQVKELGGAVQGAAYGKNEYKGPKQPFFIRNSHRYIFKFYALDFLLNLESNAGKRELLKEMEGHILQKGEICGKYKR